MASDATGVSDGGATGQGAVDQRAADGRGSGPGSVGRSLRYAKRSRRQKQDADSHADGDGVLPPPIVDHELVHDGQPALVETQPALDELIEVLRSAGTFGYDSEFIGEHTYHPEVCVLQVATASGVWLIDPLAEIDLSGFWALIADASVVKIVHAGMQDLEPCPRLIDHPPRAVFDTQVAAGFAGLPYPASLDKLVAQVAGADLGHGLKFSNWNRRPLTPLQLAYAANDVRYLPLLHDRLVDRLRELGNIERAGWACDEAFAAEAFVIDPLARRFHGKGLSRLDGKQTAALRGLRVWREGAAEVEDLPPRTLLPDWVVLALAEALPAEPGDLKAVKGLPQPVQRVYGEALVEVVAEALAGPVPKPSKPMRPKSQAEKDQLGALWRGINAHCAKQGVATQAITNKSEVTKYWWLTRRGRPTDDMPLATGWRAELLGEALTLPTMPG
ncbi:MAG: HRDC domain-containing protein [Planctomycetota bacterium]